MVRTWYQTFRRPMRTSGSPTTCMISTPIPNQSLSMTSVLVDGPERMLELCTPTYTISPGFQGAYPASSTPEGPGM